MERDGVGERSTPSERVDLAEKITFKEPTQIHAQSPLCTADLKLALNDHLIPVREHHG